MSVVGTILLVLLGLLGVLLALLLVMPLSVAVEGYAEGLEGGLEARARWGLGVLGLEYRVGEGARFRLLWLLTFRIAPDDPATRAEKKAKRAEKKAKKAEKKAKNKAAKADEPRRGGPLWAWLHRDTLWDAALRMLGVLHLRGELNGVVGMAEPDQTAWLDMALRELERVLPAGVVDVEVDYADEILDVDARFGGWVVPIHALAVGLAVYLSRDVRRALRAR